MNKKVLVVDLDRTLYTINTFHYFLIFILKQSIKTLKIILVLKLSLAIITRCYSSHAQMKYRILKLLKNRTDFNYHVFTASISQKKRDLQYLQNNNYDLKILATAAPSCYADIIAKKEGFTICLATNFSEEIYNQNFENSKGVKKDRVLEYLKSRHLNQIDTFVTDHIDDLPLIKIAKHNIIINPNKKLMTILKQNLVSFKIVN